MIQKRLFNIVDYLLVYLIIGFSANMVLLEAKSLFSIVAVFSCLWAGFRNKQFIHQRFVFVFGIVIIVQLGQIFTLNFFSINSFGSVLLLYLMSYSIIVGVPNFDEKYLKLVYFLSKVALVNLVLVNIPPYEELLKNLVRVLGFDPISHQNMLILTYEPAYEFSFFHRNAGFVYEPGIFCFVLTLAMLFEYKLSGKLFSRKNILFLISLITTLSTAGYLVVFLTFLFYIYNSKINILYKSVAFTITLSIVVYSFLSLDFLQEKLESQVQNQIENTSTEFTGGRFDSAIADFNDFKESPFFGKGRNKEVRFKVYESMEKSRLIHRTNGISDFLVEYGIFYFLLFWYLLSKSNKRYLQNKQIALLFFLSLLCIAFSQTILSRPLMVMLLFIDLINHRKYTHAKDLHLHSSSQ